MLLLDDQHRASMRNNRDEMCTLAKAQMDLKLAKMRSMTSQEAAAVAARAVAEAEAAIAEAEEAARETEAAEADAAAAQSFAEAAMKTLKGRNLPKMQMVRVDGKQDLIWRSYGAVLNLIGHVLHLLSVEHYKQLLAHHFQPLFGQLEQQGQTWISKQGKLPWA